MKRFTFKSGLCLLLTLAAVGARPTRLREREPQIEPTKDWSYQVDPFTAPPPTLSQKPIPLSAATGDFFEHAANLLMASNSPAAVVAFITEDPSKSVRDRIERIDLATGKSLGALEMPPDTRPFMLNDDGTQMLLMPAKHDLGAHDRLDLWAIDATPPKQILSFKPYEKGSWSERDIDWAAFVDKDHLLTFSSGRKLAVWKLPEMQALYTFTLDAGSQPALSPGRKFVAVESRLRVHLLDAMSGKVMGTLPSPQHGNVASFFRPDGKQLALLSSRRLTVWDLSSPPKIVHDIGFVGVGPFRRLDWLGDEYVMLDNDWLFDLPKGLVVWEYRTDVESSAAVSGSRLWHVDVKRKTTKATLASVAVPHDEAVKFAASLDANKTLAIYPGAKVSLDINVVGITAENRQHVIDTVTGKLKEIGVGVAENQPVKFAIVSVMAPLPPKEVKFFTLEHKEAGSISVGEELLKVGVVVGDKVAWSDHGTTFMPPQVTLAPGQTVEAAQKASNERALKFFEQDLPRLVAMPSGSASPKASAISTSGLSPAEPWQARYGKPLSEP